MHDESRVRASLALYIGRAEVDIRFKSQLENFQSHPFGRCQDMSPVNQVYIAVIGEFVSSSVRFAS